MTQNSVQVNETSSPEYDVIIVGAGLSGCLALIKILQLELRVKCLEAGTNVGGTWYWNRYPGCRFDSESYTYGFSFSPELQQEWNWSEHFAPQPETEKYINYMVDKFDVRHYIQFSTRVASAHFDESSNTWVLASDDKQSFRSRFFVTCLGPLSAFTLPRYPGLDEFKGQSCHTARWPKSGIDFAGKRVAVIGTGATGVQTIQEVSKTAAHLSVFQRRPNWCEPLHNSKVSPEEMEKIKKGYPELFEHCRGSFGGSIHRASPKAALETPPEEREKFWQTLYDSPGFGIWMGNYKDVLVDRTANSLLSEFIAKKIRERVKNQAVAEKLISRDHGFGTRRVPLETKYYEVYNQDNVELVDLTETPIDRITVDGIMTAHNKEYEFDVIIYATGFDPNNGPRTYLGLMVEAFPNMMMVMGPHAALRNIPISIQYGVEWISELLDYSTKNGINYIEPKGESVEEWTDTVHEAAKGLLSNDVDSWMTGVNSNVEGRQKRIVARYSGSCPSYRARCDQEAQDQYQGLKLSAK
ncbi:cyclohexanone monooxygenase [Rhizodiscina lignyota]|uniref:Cyclohexanone monooxygenase n=1 Tax=Rhizodiscina lignyota TaxID=1504668 RepID=A0A9P4I3L3_9PEZI|nr:cyclohexanone monooxygenase [Rhizodiscina lignyota]